MIRHVFVCCVLARLMCAGQVNGTAYRMFESEAYTYAISAANHRVAVLFALEEQVSLSAVLWRVHAVGTADTVRVSIQTVSAFRPDGNIVASGSTNVTSAGWYKTTFTQSATLSAYTTYALVWDYATHNGGNITIYPANANHLLFPNTAAGAHRVLYYNGASWSGGYGVLQALFVKDDDTILPAPWIGWRIEAGGSINANNGYAVEFTATRSLSISGILWYDGYLSQQGSGEARVYVNNTLRQSKTFPNYAISGLLEERRYVIFDQSVIVGAGQRVKVVLRCTQGPIYVDSATQAMQHSTAWPIWQYFGKWLGFGANWNSGTVDASDNITTQSWMLVLPLLNRYEPLSGGFVVQQ